MESKKTATQLRSIFEAVLFCVVFILIFIGLSFSKSLVPAQFERFAHGIIGTIAAFIATYIFLRVHKKRFADIGLQPENATMRRFITGLLAGIILTAVMLLGTFYLAGVKLVLNEHFNVAGFLLWTSALIPLAFMEEVAFRAYPLELLKTNTNIWLPIIVTSILFALYHVANGWSIPISFLGPGIWGLVFGFAALYSKGIAMGTGLHYAANLTQAAFGMGKGFDSIWTLQETDQTLKDTRLVGLLPQIALFIGAVIAIEVYSRKRKYHKNNVSL